eukprot:scaffold147829_cov30-Tisochrysis_lutea.AAC.1
MVRASRQSIARGGRAEWGAPGQKGARAQLGPTSGGWGKITWKRGRRKGGGPHATNQRVG